MYTTVTNNLPDKVYTHRQTGESVKLQIIEFVLKALAEESFSYGL